MKKILVLKGQSRYNVLRVAADQIAKGFHTQGFETVTIDLTAENAIQHLSSAISHPHHLIFSLQALLFDLRISNGSYLYNNIETPVFGWIVDHPIYHHQRLTSTLGSNVHLACIDQHHAAHVQAYYPSMANVHYLPHGGFTPNKIVPYQEKTINIFFPSSYSFPENALERIQALTPALKKMASSLIDTMKKYTHLTLEQALTSYLKRLDLQYSHKNFHVLLTTMGCVDHYLRAYYRELCVKNLLDYGHRLTVAGQGWESFQYKYPNQIQILSKGGLDITDVIELISQSKILLNNIPGFKAGLHERILTALNCNTACLTDTNRSIDKLFTPLKHIATYDFKAIDAIGHTAEKLLSDPHLSAEIADNGKKIVSNAHTWEYRAREILNLVESKRC